MLNYVVIDGYADYSPFALPCNSLTCFGMAGYEFKSRDESCMSFLNVINSLR